MIAVETFLNDTVPEGYGKIKGYTNWQRKDRSNGSYGGVAVCFKDSIQFKLLKIDVPNHFEMSFYRLWLSSAESLLLCVCYRPQWQGRDPIEFIKFNLDNIMLQNFCSNVIIAGDLNQHLVQSSFDDLLDTHGLCNHVDFPTHMSGSSLDPVISDLPAGSINCCPLDAVGSSDHFAVMTHAALKAL